MKKLLTTLVVLSWAFILTAQTTNSPFAGNWFGIATPTGIAARNGFTRTLMKISVSEDGAVDGIRYYYDEETLYEFSGSISPKGKFEDDTTTGDHLTLIFSRGGKGTGVGRFPAPAFPDVLLRETITLYREDVRR
jgi:hypothetical protein